MRRELLDMDDLTVLFLEVRKIANKEFDGHFTILKFTTHYKSFFGTIDIDSGDSRKRLWEQIPQFTTLNESLANMIKTKIYWV
jgi:hypothetical protein